MIFDKLSNIKNYKDAKALTENNIKEICDQYITDKKFYSLSPKEMGNKDLSKISGGVSNAKRNAALLAAFLNLNSMGGSYAKDPITIPKNSKNNISAHAIAHNNDNGKRADEISQHYFRIFSVLAAILGIGGCGYLTLHNKQRTSQQLKEDKVLIQERDKLKEESINLREENCALKQKNDDLERSIATLRRDGNMLKEKFDRLEIEEAINDPVKSKLNIKDVERFKQKYKYNVELTELLNRLEKKIRRRTDTTKLNDANKLAEIAVKAPPNVYDPKPPSLQQSGPLPVLYSGVYLWKKGYNVEGFLSNGGCGVAWKCTSKTEPSGHKVMKVLSTNPITYNSEIEATNTVAKILSEDKTGKAKRYLLNLRVVSKGSDYIIRSPLADGDLLRVSYNEYMAHLQNYDFDEVLRYAGQMLKSVKFLHDTGYTHNDIKPENFLRISTWPDKSKNDAIMTRLNQILASNEFPDKKINDIQAIPLICTFSKQLAEILHNHCISDTIKLQQISQFVTRKQSHKHKLQLTDFGSLGKLGCKSYRASNGEYYRLAEWPHLYTELYLCENDETILKQRAPWITGDTAFYTYSQYAIERDVYALGVTLMWLLIRYFNLDLKTAVTNLQQYSQDPQQAANLFYNNHYQFLNTYSRTASPAKQHAFIALIHEMINPNIFNRITLDDALAKLQQIKKSRQFGN